MSDLEYPAPTSEQIESAYSAARERYAAYGVDVDLAVAKAAELEVSIHCWQADDVVGLEPKNVGGGGILATGNHPGRARNGDEMRADFEKVVGLLPGAHRLNLHAFYAETGGATVDRDAIGPEHFTAWKDWALAQKVPLDFNTTFFAHEKAADGYTLSHQDSGVRKFWIDHGLACRQIAMDFAKAQGGACVLNHWLPDGEKDYPADRWGPRARLAESLDAILAKDPSVDPELCIDAVESKLFGLGSEACTIGSAEFYSSYALSRGVVYCLDMGHFHPTETIHDKFSAYLQFHPKLLVHTSRPMRWDSDHIVLYTDDVRDVFLELQRGQAWDRVFLAMDFFDASVNRIAAYIVGLRSTRQAILNALLDPTACLQSLEAEGRKAERLALMEAAKVLPFGAVWDYFCLKNDVPVGLSWMNEVIDYEKQVTSKRS